MVEQVVLVNEDGVAIGTAAKAHVHDTATPLHLAFSCYLFNRAGELLVTQRAESKPTWPGVWTNSCCGHPAPGESLTDAAERRLQDELGLPAAPLRLALPRFRYLAEMDNGVRENEICPVLWGVSDAEPEPHAEEIEAFRWEPWDAFAQRVLSGAEAVSPWCREQVEQLSALGPDPLRWSSASADALPPAARLT